MSQSELALVVLDWEIHLEAQGLAPSTIRGYREAATLLDRFLVAHGITELVQIDRRAIERWVIDQHKKVAPGSVITRFRALRVLFKWLTDDQGEYEISPMYRMKEPRGEDRPPDVPDVDDVRRMLALIDGKTFADRRDLALLRFLFDTGARVGEAVKLAVDDVDVRGRTAVLYGKGRVVRVAPFGAKTASALLNYLRERRKHTYEDRPELFVGQRGPISYFAAYRIVQKRAEAAGFVLTPHQARHYFAHDWLSQGGTEGDLKSLGGWKSSNVMQRYGRSAAAARAREAHKRLSPGDRL